jgi:hypothetical protein
VNRPGLQRLTEPPLGWRQILLANCTVIDGGNVTGAVAASAAGGFTLTIKGSRSTTNPLGHVQILAPAVDASGIPLDVTKDWSLEFALIEDTAPDLSSGINVSLGLINESAYSVTAEAQMVNLRYSGGGRNVGVSQFSNGVFGTLNDGASAGTLRQSRGTLSRSGTRRPEIWYAMGHDANGAPIAGDYCNNGSGNGATWITGTPYFAIGVWRDSNVDVTDRTLSFRAFFKCSPQTETVR